MRNSLDGQVVLVTGAARGMGAEHVRQLAGVGARVVATDVLDEEGRALTAGLGNDVIYQHHDVTVEADWIAAVAKAEARFGPVNHLVNNAGVVTFGSIESTDPAAFRRTIDINLTGCWLGMHYTVPSIRRAGGGSIVNISSTAGLQGYANLGSYVASKWGLRGLTKAAALELGPLGIRVNSIHPGPIRTPMIAGLDADSIVASQPIARVGEPEEVTAMLLYLLADATYSTGHEFIIDGGAVIGQVVRTLVDQD
ncbi:MAG: 3-alpha-(or 20-beta)-hydroxysteroid dehydrogenase [Myxococcota bacterium]|nr:3-alpha-(or 20-beta)-hydroxysteroid dehydrogenase [Myxococcota bacterium]